MPKTGQQQSGDGISTKDIRKRMIDLDRTVTSLADEIGKSRSAVSFAINHPTVVPAIRKKVLKILQFSNV